MKFLLNKQSKISLMTWAELISESRLGLPDLEDGLKRVYGRGGEVPKNKLGAIIGEARRGRRDRSLRLPQAPALPAGNSWDPTIPDKDSYRVHGAIERRCPQCDAGSGEWCVDSGVPRRRPHWARLSRRAGAT